MRIDNIRNLWTSSYWRCLQVTLLLFVLQLSATTRVSAEDRIVVPTLQISTGKTQKLAVHLSNKDAYTAFQAEFIFPKGITPVKDSNGKYSISLSSRKGADHSVSSNIISDGSLKVACFSMTNKDFSGDSGELFYIEIASDATFKGPAEIEVKNILFTRSSDRKEIEFPQTTGIVDTKPQTKGDVNIDGSVNAKDIVDIVKYMMGKQTGIFDSDAADTNDDYEVNSADVVWIAQKILEKK